MSRTIAIVGTINRDRIILPNGEVHEDLGGILYNTLALAPFVQEEVRILPVARIGEEERHRVHGFLDGVHVVDAGLLLWSAAGTNETVLRYITADRREETLVERIVPLTWEEIEGAAGADILLINMIWGRELTPDLLARLTRTSRGPTVLDIQSLPLTFETGPGRAYRVIRRWREWARAVHTVKGNEEEVRWFLGEGERAFAGRLIEGAARILDQGARVVLVTRGTAGFLYFSREEGDVREASFPATPGLTGEAVDTTGCGDAFSSGYVLGLLRSESPLESALLGNALAGLVSRCRGLQALRTLADPVALRERAYRSTLSRIRADREGESSSG